MKIKVLKEQPDEIEYFVDCKKPRLVVVYNNTHCVFRDIVRTIKKTHYLPDKGVSFEVKQYKVSYVEDYE